MKISLPSQMFGGQPAGLLSHFGLQIEKRPTPGQDTWQVSGKPMTLIKSQVLHGPALTRSRFDVSTPPTPNPPGGMGPELSAEFEDLVKTLDEAQTLPALFDRITATLIAVPGQQVPATTQWGSEVLAAVPLTSTDGGREPLFPRHSVHDIRINEILYRWSKLPQIFLRLRYNTAEEIIAESALDPHSLAFQASSGLLEGTVFGGIYFAPLLGNLTPTMWGFAAPRYGQLILYTLGRQLPGLGHGASRDSLDTLRILFHNNPSQDFDSISCDPDELHKAAFSEAVDWWAGRLNDTLLDIFSPMTYIDAAGRYDPATHQGWMLNFEQLLGRISAIARHPRDQAAQLMLMFPAMDLLGDRFTGSNGIGQLMTPKRLRKRIAAIETHVPARIRPLIMAPAYRGLRAAEQVLNGFFVPSPDPNSTETTRLQHLWNARRNTTHGFNLDASVLAEHNGALPADIVLVPMIYLLDILTDREHLVARIQRSCQ
ncbi:hypothetical protein [Rhodococcus sp. 05-2254-6]|uniref:hypothetical protein n=1 Tax=Rhodococcus sp. 05-2254-6 TaxID=2022489 RepID=UPI00117A1AED|nr:hypothetical protein [Rhodococcus sp. 05-2254-6]